ncbi:hypothetical protein JYT61_01070, partial [bacterium AH-315-E10]|nr:hypothetical protein [bacterium AH-315-E10]
QQVLENRFEEYVRYLLEQAGLAPIGEKTLRQRYGQGKTVDCMIHDEEQILLVEAKCVEMNHKATANQSNDLFSMYMENSIIKGVRQGIETIERGIKKGDYLKKTYSLMIVTYGDMHLGSGVDVYNEFLKESYEREWGAYDCTVLPPERIYFTAIHDLEDLVSAHACKAVGIWELLKRSTEELQPHDSHLLSFMSESEMKSFKPLAALTQRFEDLMDSVLHSIKSDP